MIYILVGNKIKYLKKIANNKCRIKVYSTALVYEKLANIINP